MSSTQKKVFHKRETMRSKKEGETRHMVLSKARYDSFIGYMVFELIGTMLLTTIVTLAIVALLLVITSERNADGEVVAKELSVLTWQLIVFLPMLISLVLVIYYRSKKYVVGFAARGDTLELLVRNLRKASIEKVSIAKSELVVEEFDIKGFWLVSGQKGTRLSVAKTNYNFITNNFIWEEQSRERKAFYSMLTIFTLNVAQQKGSHTVRHKNFGHKRSNK